MSFTDLIRQGLEAWGVEYAPVRLELLEAFSRLLIEKNRVMNLTAITEPDLIARRHMLDSLVLLRLPELQGPVVDVGTGAGFPGLPLKILRPELEITLLDSTGKRIAFIEECAGALGLEVRAVQGRAEEFVHLPGMREGFAAVLSRAVAPLNILSELCLPLTRVGGAFLPLKSLNESAEQEISAAQNALRTLGGRLDRRLPYRVEGEADDRQALVIRKEKSTPAAYPRRYGKITSKSL